MKLEWHITKNVITEIKIEGKNIINPFGIETADSYSFFSLEKGIGYKYQILESKSFQRKNKYKYFLVNKMREGLWYLKGKEELKLNKIIRKVELTCLESSNFMDFVMRFRIKKKFVNYVKIAEKKLYHTNSNIYYQYPVRNVKLVGEKIDVVIKILNSYAPQGMRLMIYARDNIDEWVVHVRFLPKVWNKIVIKLCNNWYNTQPINQKLSNLLLKLKYLKTYLWYHNERNPYKNRIMKFINPNAFPIISLKKGDKISLSVEFAVISKKYIIKISIIIPTYNRPNYLDRLLNSISKQTYKNYEVIVIDDASVKIKEYDKIISKYKNIFKEFKYLRNNINRGAPYSRNLGIKESKYEYIALVDDDDEWEPTKLERQVMKFRNSNENVGIVYTWTKVMYNKIKIGEYTSTLEGKLQKEILEECFIPSPSVLIKKKCLIDAGLFDEGMPSCQDWDMWTRIIYRGYECKVVKSFETIYHKHDDTTVGKSVNALKGYKIYYRKHWKKFVKNYLKEKRIKELVKYLIKIVRGF